MSDYIHRSKGHYDISARMPYLPCQLAPWEETPVNQSNFNQNTKLIIHEIASENIFCKMA